MCHKGARNSTVCLQLKKRSIMSSKLLGAHMGNWWPERGRHPAGQPQALGGAGSPSGALISAHCPSSHAEEPWQKPVSHIIPQATGGRVPQAWDGLHSLPFIRGAALQTEVIANLRALRFRYKVRKPPSHPGKIGWSNCMSFICTSQKLVVQRIQ